MIIVEQVIILFCIRHWFLKF